MSAPHRTVILTIDSLSNEGPGVGRDEGLVYFVPFSAPGDRIEATVVEEHSRYARAEIVRVLARSGERREPACRHFGVCGGCVWQHVAYERQLREKAAGLAETLKRVGGLAPPLEAIVPSPTEYGYRGRARLHVRNDGALGYYAAGSRDVVEIEECPILDPRLAAALAAARKAMRESRGPRPAALALELLETGEVRTVPLAESDPVPPFRQANPAVNGRLRSTVEQAVAALPRELRSKTLVDLYCGDGNVSLPAAAHVREVLGYDADSGAIARAERNAAAAGCSNARYVAARVEEACRALGSARRDIGCIIADPPRSGLGRAAGAVADLAAPFLVYVSCVPAVLARDLARFVARGYRVRTVIPFDMFPQTAHLESIALLDLRQP